MRKSATVVWLLLVLATGASWWLSGGVGTSHAVAAAALLLLAFVKVRLIVMYFMEVHWAPIALRLGFDAWVTAVYCALLLLYLRTPG
jgi:hypothetical protein